MAGPQKHIREEVPWDDLEEVMKNYPEVTLRIQRRNAKGHLLTLAANVNMETKQLTDIEDWLQAFAGGGQYELEVKNPASPADRLVPRFKVRLEGAMRPPRFLGNPEDQYPEPQDPYGQPAHGPVSQQSGFQAPLGPWGQGLTPSQQRQYISGGRPQRPAPGATMASDQLAMQQFAEYKAEHSKTMQKLESQVERLLEESRRKDEALAAERERAREERHKSELSLIREQLRMMSEAPKVESKGTADMVAALAPFAPVLAAMVTSRETSASKSLEVQQQGLASLMNATLSQANKPDSTTEMLKTFGPLLIPFVKDMMDNKSPEKQALLYNAMAENSLSSLAMMAQLIESFASQGGDPDPWWLGPVKEALGGVVGMTEAYMMSKGGLPGQAPQAPRQIAATATASASAPKPTQPTQTQFAAPSYKTEDADTRAAAPTDPDVYEQAEVVDDVPSPDPVRARSRADRAMQFASTGVKPGNGVEDTLSQGERTLLSFLPEAFQTPEWRAIVVALQRQEDPEDVADLCASYILHLINFNLLPEALSDITVDPARALDRLLQPLPIMQHNPEYAVAVMQQTIEMLIEAEAIETPEPIAEIDDAPAPPVAQHAS